MDKEQLVSMLRMMIRIRKFETRVAELYAQGKIPGFVHLYIGEEAVATGTCANLRTDDFITSTHRGHGHCLAKGGDMKRMMAELFAKRTGYCKGKGGSMHIADVDMGILGANGIVGGGLSIAPGAALSAKIRGTDQVAVCFFGDGASNQTTFHEGINFASVWNLPVVFVCENNLFGMYTAQSRHQRITDVADRAVAYGIPGVVVDGNDVMAVYEAVGEAVKRARAGEGPTLVECKTYRWRGHAEGDPALYRKEEEVLEWKARCPIARFRKHLMDLGMLTEEEADAIELEVDQEVEEAVRFADESPAPAPEEALEDVYA
ncbi:MAG: pyruvate dehydrogenase (acetyl-transferring) E1 component subunit alpha [bacterium]|jgi:pyruvate dehydrogenase E1 component alpha subunit